MLEKEKIISIPEKKEEGPKVFKRVYFPKEIPEDESLSIARDLTPLTAEGFMQNTTELTEALIQDVRNHVCGSERLVVAYRAGMPCAFICSSLIEVDEGLLYHLEGIIVETALQGNGFAEEFVNEELQKTRADLIGFHTQSKKMFCLGKKIADFSTGLAHMYGPTIHSVKMVGGVDKGRYGSCLYGDIERFRPDAIEEINWMNGDALICIGSIKNKR